MVISERGLWSNLREEAHRLLENIALPPLLLSETAERNYFIYFLPGDAGLVIDNGVTERIEGERCGELSLTTRPGQIIPIDIMHSDIDM